MSSSPRISWLTSIEFKQCQATISGNKFTITCLGDKPQEVAQKTFRQCEDGFKELKTCRETRMTPGGAVCSGGWEIKKVPK